MLQCRDFIISAHNCLFGTGHIADLTGVSAAMCRCRQPVRSADLPRFIGEQLPLCVSCQEAAEKQ
jgi:hypothetical protein